MGAGSSSGERRLAALGHRVVHGGLHHSQPGAGDRRSCSTSWRRWFRSRHCTSRTIWRRSGWRCSLNPDLPQIACFDTAFHRTMPELDQAFALPHALYDEGIRRYGFHGLSYEYIASVLPTVAPEIADGRVVVAHLGNGSSACALREGKSVATTMGFTALDGLPMGTRCGALDPGIVLHLLQQKGHVGRRRDRPALPPLGDARGFRVSRRIFATCLASAEPRARFAIDCSATTPRARSARWRRRSAGVDGIVFTAGVGENAAPVRSAICRACAWLGLELDETANREHRPQISAQGSRVAAYVLKTDENLMIARHTSALVRDAPLHASGPLS